LRFVQVDHDQQRLRRQKLEPAQPLQIFPFEIERTKGSALFERCPAHREDVPLAFELRCSPLFEILLQTFETAFGHSKVRQDQLVFHCLRIPCGVD
jgi:hypothetical protein